MPKTPAKDVEEKLVSVRVTKFGSGKVATGEYVVGHGDVFASKDDLLDVSPAIAKELEKRALAEIVD